MGSIDMNARLVHDKSSFAEHIQLLLRSYKISFTSHEVNLYISPKLNAEI